MSRKRTIIVSLIILLAGAVVITLIFRTEPKAIREGATREAAMLVEVTGVSSGSFHPSIVTTGTVEPSQDIILSPKVSGEIIRLSPAFTPGGFVKKGQVLLQIERADYENILQMRKSDLHQAMADLELEMGRQEIAQMDYQLLDESISLENEALVLREPQLNAVKSRIEAAQAAVSQAELNLERTTIKAPFDAHVLDRNANVGSQVSPGNNIGRLVGMDDYWVIATVPLAKLRWLSFPDASHARGSEVRIRNQAGWKDGEYRTGYLYKLVGALDDQTRLARILITVPDPFALRTENRGLPALMIGAFVETDILSDEITDVIRINRDYVRKDETVWIFKDGKLQIRDVEIAFTDAQYAYIAGGVEKDDQVVITNLSTVVNGVRLRVKEDSLPGQPSVPNPVGYK